MKFLLTVHHPFSSAALLGAQVAASSAGPVHLLVLLMRLISEQLPDSNDNNNDSISYTAAPQLKKPPRHHVHNKQGWET